MKTLEQNTIKRDIYQIVTDKIIEQLEKGCIPWKQPWSAAGIPTNLITKKPYRGINIWLLSLEGYSQNYFLTYNQALKIGTRIRKGEKSHLVVFWKREEKENKSGEVTIATYLRYYKVFNISQCELVPENLLLIEQSSNKEILNCQQVIHQMHKCPLIKHGSSEAYYNPIHDYISIPNLESFKNSESYYSTLFHEMIHSTGHISRLNREGIMKRNGFGSDLYSFEELIAELGSSYLNSITGIDYATLQHNASYLQGWLKQLKNDKKLIVSASTQSQKAVDYILGNISVDVSSEDNPFQ